MPRSIATKTILSVIVIGGALITNSARAGKAQTRLHVSVIVTGQCSVRPPIIDEEEHLRRSPDFACNHTRPIRYHWDNLPDHDTLMNEHGYTERYGYEGYRWQEDSSAINVNNIGQRQSILNPRHTLTILY